MSPLQHRPLMERPADPGHCEECRRPFPDLASGESVHCRCDGTFVVHAPGILIPATRDAAPEPRFEVGDRVRITSRWRDREGQEGEVVLVDPPITEGEVFYAVHIPALDKRPPADVWCRARELTLVRAHDRAEASSPSSSSRCSCVACPDDERLDWLDEDPGRLEDVRGHYVNVEGCSSVREAIDTLRRMP